MATATQNVNINYVLNIYSFFAYCNQTQLHWGNALLVILHASSFKRNLSYCYQSQLPMLLLADKIRLVTMPLPKNTSIHLPYPDHLGHTNNAKSMYINTV